MLLHVALVYLLFMNVKYSIVISYNSCIYSPNGGQLGQFQSIAIICKFLKDVHSGVKLLGFREFIRKCQIVFQSGHTITSPISKTHHLNLIMRRNTRHIHTEGHYYKIYRLKKLL